jgi:tetraacyldisaccharide 4'-kinase
MCDKITKNSKLKTQNCGVAILTRGYKATKNPKPKTQNYGDEPATLAESCPETKVIINPDRVAGAVEAITKFGVKVLVMDDGFQHRRLHRDLDIVTIDATLPFGYGRMLPAGLLREPVTSLNRADAVVITRCDQISQSQLIELEAKLQQFNLNMVIARSIHRPVCAKLADGKEISIEQLRDRKIFAFCGIGNPRAFLSTIKSTGAEVVGSKIYDDHHHYTPSDKSSIYEQAGNLKAELILTTQKDWTRIPASGPAPKDIPLAYLTIEIKFLAGEDKLINLIEKTLTGKILEK